MRARKSCPVLEKVYESRTMLWKLLVSEEIFSYGYFITAGLILDLPLVIARWMDSNGYNLQLYNIYFIHAINCGVSAAQY